MWLRRCVACGLVLCALAVSLAKRDPTVITLNHSVSAGETLSAADLAHTPIPKNLVPDKAVRDIAVAEDKVAVAELTRGQVLTEGAFTGEGVTPPGKTSVPLRLSDPAVGELLKTGDTVTVVASDGSIVCDKATVILPRKETVLISLDNDLAPAVASATLNGPVTVVVRSAGAVSYTHLTLPTNREV